MAREAEYKPLLYTTTMRNPERLKFMLFVLNKFRGQILNDNLATKICAETIRYGLYRPMKKSPSIIAKWSTTPQGSFSDFKLDDKEVAYMLKNNPQKHKEAGFEWGFPSRFATIYDLTKELGLAYYSPGKPIEISELGEHLINSIEVSEEEGGFITVEIIHPEYEQQVFLLALAKSQRQNPFVRVLNDNVPLLLLLQTIKLLNADPRQNSAGIARHELPLLIFWKDNNAQALYERIVKLRKEHRYNPSDEVILDICVNEIMEGEYKKFEPKSIMVDYPDEFIRKMRMTGLISLRGAGRFVDINHNEDKKIAYILDNYSQYRHFDTERAYFDYMSMIDENLIKIEALKVSESTSENLLKEWLNVYNWAKIKNELGHLSDGSVSRDDVLKLLAAPVRLEFLTALAIKSQLPEVRVVPNYSCDDTGLPTSTAGGNKGDIECFEQAKGVLVEVTMATGRTQTMMEIWPIERHLDEFSRNQESQCVFVAPSIYPDSQRQIDFVCYQSNGKKVIRPYPISEFINFLDTAQKLYA